MYFKLPSFYVIANNDNNKNEKRNNSNGLAFKD